jgi:site-specific DNA recombinase
VCLPTRYDDGGFTGGNLDRPALQRLLTDIKDGCVDCVVVYKIDRLSRSLLDFSRLRGVFEQHHVAFVSTTQQFSTSTSMGRLVLNVLLSFAQFEREIIAERTRDKIAATRRKGKWSGGPPVLGYDLDLERPRLMVNAAEAAHVREIFGLYLEHEALLPVVQELNRRGWTTKRWTTRPGQIRGGLPFTKNRLHPLLTNVLYTGQVRYKEEVHPWEHPPLVKPETWQRVQTVLAWNGRSGGGKVRNRFGALLKGLLRCSTCACSMTPTHTTRKGRRYRYYVCYHAQQRGWGACPAPSVSAGALEQLVLGQVQRFAQDPAFRLRLSATRPCLLRLPCFARAVPSIPDVNTRRRYHAGHDHHHT